MPKSRKVPIDAKAFGGINKLHTRNIAEPSDGKNFWTRNGSLYSREGCSVVEDPDHAPTPFTNEIGTINTASKVSVTTRLFIEEGTNLWVRLADGLAFEKIKDDVDGNGYNTTTWSTPYGDSYLLLVSGSQGLVYNIAEGTLDNLINNDGDVPNFEHVTNWKGYVFGWAPNWPGSNLIRFCGYDSEMRQSIDYWPLDFAINPSNNPGEPVYSCHPYQTHLFVLTDKGSYRIYGDSEENFTPSPAGSVGVYDVGCSALVRDTVIWYTVENDIRKVYGYSGTQPVLISQPIEELLQAQTKANMLTRGIGSQFWLLFRDSVAKTTTAFVFDADEKGWYIHEFPFDVSAIGSYGDYGHSEGIHLGLKDGRLLLMDDSDKDIDEDITTEFVIGPLDLQSRKFKVKTFWLNAEPKVDFNLDVYAQADSQDEIGPITVSFEAGNQATKKVGLIGIKGQNVSLRVTTTEKINALQKFDLTVVPKAVK